VFADEVIAIAPWHHAAGSGHAARVERSAQKLATILAEEFGCEPPGPVVEEDGRLQRLAETVVLAGVVASFAPMIFLLFYQAESWFMVGLVGALFWTLLDLLMPGFFRFTLRGRFRQVLETRFGIER